MAMYCKYDRRTRLTEAFDYCDYCGHCGAVRYAWKRAINDLIRGGLAGEINFDVSFEEFWLNGTERGKPYGSDFSDLWGRAWNRWHKADKRLYGTRKPPPPIKQKSF